MKTEEFPQTIYTEAGDPIEAHRIDDPNVWGLLDVVLGRLPLVPTTVYKSSGDSASGVVGLLLPSGVFLSASASRVGREVTLTQDGETFTVETRWDGAVKAAPFVNEDGERAQEHSRGLLLGDYQIHREVTGPKKTSPFERNRTKKFGSQSGQASPQGTWTYVDSERKAA